MFAQKNEYKCNINRTIQPSKNNAIKRALNHQDPPLLKNKGILKKKTQKQIDDKNANFETEKKWDSYLFIFLWSKNLNLGFTIRFEIEFPVSIVMGRLRGAMAEEGTVRRWVMGDGSGGGGWSIGFHARVRRLRSFVEKWWFCADKRVKIQYKWNYSSKRNYAIKRTLNYQNPPLLKNKGIL